MAQLPSQTRICVKVIPSIFILVMEDNYGNYTLSAQLATHISKDLYGSDILSGFEMAKGFHWPIQNGSTAVAQDHVTQALTDLDTEGQVACIL